MKTIYKLTIAALMAASFTACTGDSNSKSSLADPSASTTPSTTATPTATATATPTTGTGATSGILPSFN